MGSIWSKDGADGDRPLAKPENGRVGANARLLSSMDEKHVLPPVVANGVRVAPSSTTLAADGGLEGIRALPSDLLRLTFEYVAKPNQWMLWHHEFFRSATVSLPESPWGMVLSAAELGLTSVMAWSHQFHPHLWVQNDANWNLLSEHAAKCDTPESLEWLQQNRIQNHSSSSSKSSQKCWFESSVMVSAMENRNSQNVVWLVERGVKWPPETIEKMVRHNRLDLLRWVVDLGEGKVTESPVTAAGWARLRVSDCQRDARRMLGDYDSRRLFSVAARYASLDLWKWLATRYLLLSNVSSVTVRIACEAGNVAVLEHLYGRQGIWATTLSPGALDVAQWWHSVLPNDDNEDALSSHLRYAHTPATIDWLLNHGAATPTTAHACEHLARENRLDLIQHVRNPKLIRRTDQTDQTDMTDQKKGEHESGVWPWSEEVCRIAARQGNVEMLLWVQANGCPSPPASELAALVLAAKATAQQPESPLRPRPSPSASSSSSIVNTRRDQMAIGLLISMDYEKGFHDDADRWWTRILTYRPRFEELKTEIRNGLTRRGFARLDFDKGVREKEFTVLLTVGHYRMPPALPTGEILAAVRILTEKQTRLLDKYGGFALIAAFEASGTRQLSDIFNSAETPLPSHTPLH